MKKIILVGGAASGKDFFKDYLTKEGFMPSVSHTTRPMREGEEQGKTYHFVTDNEFSMMVNQEKFREHKIFNGWKYGTTNDSFVKSDVFIFTPSGIDSLDVTDFLVVYFDIAIKYRIERLSKRSDSDSVNRRITADLMDFHDFSDYEILVTDPKYDPVELKSLILKNI